MNDEETAAQILRSVESLRATITEVKTALVGDMNSRGLLHEVDRLEERVDDLRVDVGPSGSLKARLDLIESEPKVTTVEHRSTVVEVVRIVASPSGAVVAFLCVVALAILIAGALGQSTDIRDIQLPRSGTPTTPAPPALSEEERAAIKAEDREGLLQLLAGD